MALWKAARSPTDTATFASVSLAVNWMVNVVPRFAGFGEIKTSGVVGFVLSNEYVRLMLVLAPSESVARTTTSCAPSAKEPVSIVRATSTGAPVAPIGVTAWPTDAPSTSNSTLATPSRSETCGRNFCWPAMGVASTGLLPQSTNGAVLPDARAALAEITGRAPLAGVVHLTGYALELRRTATERDRQPEQGAGTPQRCCIHDLHCAPPRTSRADRAGCGRHPRSDARRSARTCPAPRRSHPIPRAAGRGPLQPLPRQRPLQAGPRSRCVGTSRRSPTHPAARVYLRH